MREDGCLKVSQNLSAPLAILLLALTGIPATAQSPAPATPQWNAAASSISSVQVVSVLWTPGTTGVDWIGTNADTATSEEEKRTIANHHLSGTLEVIKTEGYPGSTAGPRIIVIQKSPIKSAIHVKIPPSGSDIYAQEGDTLAPLETNRPASQIPFEVFPTEGATAFYAGYRSGPGFGGVLFWWDKQGRPIKTTNLEPSTVQPPSSKKPATARASATPDLTVVSVLQSGAGQLAWKNERPFPLALSNREKNTIAKGGITGDVDVVAWSGIEHGKARVLVIQHEPLITTNYVPVPTNGTYIYVQKDQKLIALTTDSQHSGFKLLVVPDSQSTSYSLIDPEGNVRCHGLLFWWDPTGKFQGP